MEENNTINNGNGLGLSIVKNILDSHKFKYGCNIKDDTSKAIKLGSIFIISLSLFTAAQILTPKKV